MLFIKLALFYFFYFAAVGIYMIFLPKVLHDIGYSSFLIGVVLAVAPLVKFITPFLFLKHIKLDRNLFVTALFFSFICSCLFYLTIHNFYLFALNNAILALCLSLILPYIEVIAIKKLRKKYYGKARLFGSIGFSLIALILGKVLEDPLEVIDYYLLTNIGTIVCALLLLKDDIKHYVKAEKEEKFSFIKYWQFWAALLFMQMSFGPFYNFFTIYETEHGISLKVISYLWTFAVVCEIFMLYYQGSILKNNLLFLIKICVGMTIIRWLILYIFPHSLTMIFISQSLHAFSFALFHSSVIMYLFTLYDNKKLAQQFMYGVGYGLGGFIGSMIAGLVYGDNLFLYSVFFASCSFICLLLIKSK